MELENFKIIEQYLHKFLFLIQTTIKMKVSIKHNSQTNHILDRIQ
jgi:hypothetical protein